MENEVIHELGRLIEEVWTENVRKDFREIIHYEADLVASFCHHLRTRLEEEKEKCNLRLGLEREPGRPTKRRENGRKRNDLHIISRKGKEPTLIAFEFKWGYGVSGRHLKGDIPKLKELPRHGIKRAYLCIADLKREPSKNGVRNGKIREYVERQNLSREGRKDFYWLALGARDEDEEKERGIWAVEAL